LPPRLALSITAQQQGGAGNRHFYRDRRFPPGSGPKKPGQEKWSHKSENYPGWIKLQRRDDGTLAIAVQSNPISKEWQLLTSLVGFLDRHFRSSISSMTISYDRGK
jgi:hypothetical protein